MAEELFEVSPSKPVLEKEFSLERFYQTLLQRLKKHKRRALRLLRKKHAATLAWFSQQKQDFNQLKTAVVNYTAGGTVAAAILVATAAPVVSTSMPHISPSAQIENLPSSTSEEYLLAKINAILTRTKHNPPMNDEQIIANLISQHFNIPVKSELAGYRLNCVVGIMGAEQHLKLYPQDNLAVHFTNQQDKALFGHAGIAYHKGAFGYFANSKAEVNEDLILKEKYYIAVQTFLIPGWETHWPSSKDWFKFRKMLVFNPTNGKAVIAVIGDAGPAQWTGKHFGGSPEVIHELGLSQGPRKGEVIVLFVDESNREVNLGPIKGGVLASQE